MATQAEFDEWKREDEDNKEKMESKLENIKIISIGIKEKKLIEIKVLFNFLNILTSYQNHS